MLALVLPGRLGCGAEEVSRFSDKVLGVLREADVHVSLFVYTEDELLLLHPERQILIQVAQTTPAPKFLCKLESVRSFLGRVIKDADHEEWLAKAYRGIVKKTPELKEGESRRCCFVEAVRFVSVLMATMVPQTSRAEILAVGSADCSGDLSAAQVAVASARSTTLHVIDTATSGASDWEALVPVLSGGTYLHCDDADDFGPCVREILFEALCTPKATVEPPADHPRRRAGGCFFRSVVCDEEDDSHLAPTLGPEHHATLAKLDVPTEVEKAREAAFARCKLAGKSTPFECLPLGLPHEADHPVRVSPDCSGRSSLDVCASAEVIDSLSTGLPLFSGVEQAMNAFECSEILKRLAELLGQCRWKDPTLPLRAYVPIIQRHLGYMARGDERFCGEAALRKMVKSVIIATDEGILRKVLYNGFHPHAKKLTSSALSEMSECWMALAWIAHCFRSVQVYSAAVGFARDRFLRNHSRAMMRAKVESRQAEERSNEDLDVAATKMHERLTRVGMRKTVEQCRQQIAEARRKRARKNKRKTMMDPVVQEEALLLKKRDEAEVAATLQHIIDTGFHGMDVPVPLDQFKKSDKWAFVSSAAVREELSLRTERYPQLAGQEPRLSAKEAAALRVAAAREGESFHVHLFDL